MFSFHIVLKTYDRFRVLHHGAPQWRWYNVQNARIFVKFCDSGTYFTRSRWLGRTICTGNKSKISLLIFQLIVESFSLLTFIIFSFSYSTILFPHSCITNKIHFTPRSLSVLKMSYHLTAAPFFNVSKSKFFSTLNNLSGSCYVIP